MSWSTYSSKRSKLSSGRTREVQMIRWPSQQEAGMALRQRIQHQRIVLLARLLLDELEQEAWLVAA